MNEKKKRTMNEKKTRQDARARMNRLVIGALSGDPSEEYLRALARMCRQFADMCDDKISEVQERMEEIEL